MGKFEKFVVLAVLFLVTLILVVSLNTNEPETLAQASLGGVEELTQDPVVEPASELVPLWKAEDIDEVVTEPEALEEEAFDPATALLSGQVEEAVVIESDFLLPEDLIELPEGTLITQPIGLSETLDPNTFSIAVMEDDTYQSIALKYYGDESYAGMIRQANDDPMTSPSHEIVMLPAFDVRVQRKDRVSGKTYKVLVGDTFTGIAQKVYGNANQWKKIYEANLDKVSSETGLRPGMTLAIP